jgi:hypothetical protein
VLQPDFLRLRLSSGAAQKAEKLFAYRKRRPERPPAGTIACHTKLAHQILINGGVGLVPAGAESGRAPLAGTR